MGLSKTMFLTRNTQSNRMLFIGAALVTLFQLALGSSYTAGSRQDLCIKWLNKNESALLVAKAAQNVVTELLNITHWSFLLPVGAPCVKRLEAGMNAFEAIQAIGKIGDADLCHDCETALNKDLRLLKPGESINTMPIKTRQSIKNRKTLDAIAKAINEADAAAPRHREEGGHGIFYWPLSFRENLKLLVHQQQFQLWKW